MTVYRVAKTFENQKPLEHIQVIKREYIQVIPDPALKRIKLAQRNKKITCPTVPEGRKNSLTRLTKPLFGDL